MKIIRSLFIGIVIILTSPSVHAARYALLVGIDEYAPDFSSPLIGCINDANGMKRCLTADSSRWTASKITTYLNAEATKTAIRSKLNALANTAVSGDLVVYCQSSHGGQNSGTDTFLCTYEDNYEDEELAADLSLFKDGVKIIILIDACHSGGLFKGTAGSAPVKPVWDFSANVMRHYNATAKTTLSKGASIGWITACNFDELSWSGICYGVFTGNLIYGFAYGDANADGILSFQELFDYAAPKALLINPGQTAQSYNTSVLASTDAAALIPSDTALRNAIDQSTLSVHAAPGPGATWFRQTGTKHDGIDAAQSGNVTDGQGSEFGTRVVGPGTLTYWWRSSCETDWDFLLFYVDGNNLGAITGETSWEQQSYEIGPGEHHLRWAYQKDEIYSEGSDCGWVDQVTWAPKAGTASPLLPNAIDDLMLPIKTGGDALWYRETPTTHDGTDAAQSQPCSDTQCTWFTAELIGPGDLSFWWKVSSEEGYDFLEFSTDETVQSRISGNTSWQQQTFALGTGTHTVGWSYAKDYSDDGVVVGSDCGWVDQVLWTGECDTDGDGLPTGWELACGLSPTDSSGPNGSDGNPDQDALSNLEEYIAGMHPINAASCFQITNRTWSAGSMEGCLIEWPTVAGRSYNLLWAPTLTNTFQVIEPDILYPRHSCTDTVYTVEQQGFYRVEVQLQ